MLVCRQLHRITVCCSPLPSGYVYCTYTTSICHHCIVHMHSISHPCVYPVAGIGPWKLAMLAACLFLWDIS